MMCAIAMGIRSRVMYPDGEVSTHQSEGRYIVCAAVLFAAWCTMTGGAGHVPSAFVNKNSVAQNSFLSPVDNLYNFLLIWQSLPFFCATVMAIGHEPLCDKPISSKLPIIIGSGVESRICSLNAASAYTRLSMSKKRRVRCGLFAFALLMLKSDAFFARGSTPLSLAFAKFTRNHVGLRGCITVGEASATCFASRT